MIAKAAPLSLLAGLALTLSICPAPAHAAAPEQLVTVTPGSGLLNTSETRATGHVDYTKFGLHVWTEGATSTDKAAGYVAVDYPLTDVGSPSFEWLYNDLAHTMEPGMQIVIDKDNDGLPNGILVGEPKYYGADWWSGSAGLTDSGLSCPSGCGNVNSGTLDEWRAAYPDARVKAVGFSLGSGAHGNGTLLSMTYGGTRYEFSNVEPTSPTVVTPKATAKVMPSRCDRVRIKFHVRKLTEGTVADKAKTVFKVTDRGHKLARAGLAPGSTSKMRFRLGAKQGLHVYRVHADGELVLTYKVRNSCD